MHAEVVAIGSELTTGARLDTNSQWLSVELASVGIPVGFHTTVDDDLARLTAALRTAIDRSDVVLVTGGLGPTQDDLTRDAIAAMLGVDLILDDPSLEHIRGMFASRGREMPDRNITQAMFPAGSSPIPNPNGTAPGVWVEVPRENGGKNLLAAMPGVPSEMKAVFRDSVLPRLPAGGRIIRQAELHCFGVGESAAEELLGDVTARGRDPEVGITVHEATITLRITADGDGPDDAAAKIESTTSVIRERLGNLVFGEQGEELEHVVLRLLAATGATLATAESGTGGLLAHRLTDVDGYEQSYLGGVVVPTTLAKRELMNVDCGLIEEHGEVSEPVVKAMAQRCREMFGTDYALAVSECSKNIESTHNPLAAATWLALASAKDVATTSLTAVGDPAIQKSRTAKAAMNMLRLRLL